MKIKKRLAAIAATVLLIGIGILLQVLGMDFVAVEAIEDPPATQLQQDSETDYELAEVVRVKDGDTIEVTIVGTRETVRLIGIDCPESVHPDKSKNNQAGYLASEFTKTTIPEGTIVYLEKDISDRDKYHRLLRYVWIEQPKNKYDSQEIEKKLLNAILVKEGHALPKEYPPDTKYSEYFDKFAYI